MITPQELRIGNIVQGTPFSVPRLGMSSDGIQTIQAMGIVALEQALKRGEKSPFTGIPLTEEWLLKFGFVLNDDGGDMKGNDRFWSRPGFLGSLSIPNLKHSTTGLYIRHVHQLQNLYFALTGEELTPHANIMADFFKRNSDTPIMRKAN